MGWTLQSEPKGVNHLTNLLVVQFSKTRAAEDHKVERINVVLMVPERFPDQTFDAIAIDSTLDLLFRQNESDSGLVLLIRCRQQQEMLRATTQSGVIKNPFKLCRPQKTSTAGERSF
tara:strand:+ start:284 stop:634 length:351 start_codon:yes stop_codon:yes gene_type:complete